MIRSSRVSREVGYDERYRGLSLISNTVSLVHSTLLSTYSAMMNQSMNSIA